MRRAQLDAVSLEDVLAQLWIHNSPAWIAVSDPESRARAAAHSLNSSDVGEASDARSVATDLQDLGLRDEPPSIRVAAHMPQAEEYRMAAQYGDMWA